MMPQSLVIAGESSSRPLTFADLGEGRANNFDFLRFALATLVIFSHSFDLLGREAREFLRVGTGGQISGGEVAVDGFFILSGFLITRSWLRSSGIGAYFRNRFLRIYPGFLAAVAFCVLVACPLGSHPPFASWPQVRPVPLVLGALNLSPPDLQTAGSHPVPVNGSLWTIRFEFACYVVVAILGSVGLLRRPRWVVAAMLVAMGLYAGQIYRDWKMPFEGRVSLVICYTPFWPRLMACFLAGAVFFLYRDRIPNSPQIALVLAAGLVFLGGVPVLRALPLGLVVAGAYLLFFLARLPVPHLQGFARRGDFSYGLYLYAFPVQVLLVRWIASGWNPWALSAVALPVTLVLAILSWHVVEKPFLRRKEKHLAMNVPPSPAAPLLPS